jgi:hypothetical protein
MPDCPIPRIDFDLFWKVSSVVIIPAALNFWKDLPVRFEEYKKTIKQSAGADPDTEIPYLLPTDRNSLVEFDLSKRLMWLIRCLYASLFCVLIYYISVNIPQPFDTIWYRCLVSLGTILGLVPTFVSILIGINILALLVKMYKESSKIRK